LLNKGLSEKRKKEEEEEERRTKDEQDEEGVEGLRVEKKARVCLVVVWKKSHFFHFLLFLSSILLS